MCERRGPGSPGQGRAAAARGHAHRMRGLRPAAAAACCLAAGCPGDMGPLPALLWPATALPGAGVQFSSSSVREGSSAEKQTKPRCCLLSLAIRRSGLPAIAGLQAIAPMALRRKTV